MFCIHAYRHLEASILKIHYLYISFASAGEYRRVNWCRGTQKRRSPYKLS